MKKSPEISYDEFMADVEKILNKPSKFKSDVLTQDQRNLILEAHKKGTSYTALVELCGKHFNLLLGDTAMRNSIVRWKKNEM